VEEYCTAKQAADDSTICCMHYACWIRKATGTYYKYVILIAFPWQQWLLEHASTLCYIYIACLTVSQKRCTGCVLNSAHAVAKFFTIIGVRQFQKYSPFKKSRESRQSFYHRHAQPSVIKVV
jgi:hypothetical protein